MADINKLRSISPVLLGGAPSALPSVAAQPAQDHFASMMSRFGRNGDTEMAHVTPGEMVIPKDLLKDGKLRDQIALAFRRRSKEVGTKIDPRRYVVGWQGGPTNPATGKEEFFGTADDGATDDAIGEAAAAAEADAAAAAGMSDDAFGGFTGADLEAATGFGNQSAAGGGGVSSADVAALAQSFAPATPSANSPGGIGLGTEQQQSMISGPDAISSALDSYFSNTLGFNAAKGLGALAQAIGVPGTTETAASAVAAQEADAAAAGAGDYGTLPRGSRPAPGFKSIQSVGAPATPSRYDIGGYFSGQGGQPLSEEARRRLMASALDPIFGGGAGAASAADRFGGAGGGGQDAVAALVAMLTRLPPQQLKL